MQRLSMNILLKPLSMAVCSAAVCAGTALCAALPAVSQVPVLRPQPRITAQIDNSSRVTLAGSRPPRALPADDIGVVPSTMKLQGISLVFSRSAAQQTALDALVAAQQNPASPLYHQWIAPDQYAAQFGVADADIAAVKAWLEQQGFSVDAVARSRNRIFFSGTAGQVASAFGVPLHYYLTPAMGNLPATTHFAPSDDLTIPAALSSSVLAIGNLSNFRPRSHLALRHPQTLQPRFTSSETGNHYLTPGDLATIYDITPAYNAGFTGSNQSIAVVGQSAIFLTDISNFQTAVGIAGKTPIITLVPNSGTSEVYANGDEAESDLDLEYSSTIAKGAQVYFVYVGNSNSYSVWNSIEYAIDERIAPIISSSYGECEPELGQSEYNTYTSYLEQAAAQGQTVVAPAGDDGSTDCYGSYASRDTADNEQLAVDFPGSSQYVTSMGGTEFPAADIVSGNNTYFAAETTTDIISSAKSYIPEMVWNDDTSSDSSSPLSAGGGGVSIYSPHPSWQTGTIGGVAIPTSSFRMVPDISLTASPNNAPFAFCTSDTTFWNTAANGGTAPYQQASCNDGLRDSASQLLTVGGGTSFDAPTFAGLVAIINQSQNSTGQGVVNSTLYSVAATTAYSTAFHDITSGGNQCTAGTAYCSTAGAANYAATTGYDEASGLGSIDFYNLLTAWPSSTTSPLISTSTTLTAATTIPAIGAADAITITVAPLTTSTTTPSGTVSVTVDGGPPATLTLTGGVATYSFQSATAGTHVIAATYSGNGTFGASTGTLTVDVGGTSSFTLTATNVSVATGASGTGTITITPNGYTGTVDLAIVPTTLLDGCVVITPSVAVSGTAPVNSATYTVYTSSTSCTNIAAAADAPGQRVFMLGSHTTGSFNASAAPHQPKSPRDQESLILKRLHLFSTDVPQCVPHIAKCLFYPFDFRTSSHFAGPF
jgi:subtilase family serine protease